MARLTQAAQTFRALPELLADLPDEVKRSANIPLNDLDRRMGEWGLL
ncbi:hypothetical protein Pssp01_18560 [Pseudomonas sp. NBRC 100443]|nr:hypothetical protein Pssp01_18560 [Pseudomonas sp. NBRC 100443]